ncbi:phosphatase PAP2 family protein [Nesterenkonia halobia]|uniref:Phosphatidic acid phosphatase type 2/haloperoxidase domain-containing protein n=1 Tax=Nesterenkonia halobia TaxID=37922 RepID=A0ABP6RER8_9MICC
MTNRGIGEGSLPQTEEDVLGGATAAVPATSSPRLPQMPSMPRITPTTGVTPGSRAESAVAGLTSIPMLAAILAAVTALALGPASALDVRLHGHWAEELTPELLPLFRDVLDKIAGQSVCLPVLALVAGALAWKHRSWRPLACAALAEAAFFLGIGGMKILFARPAPKLGNPEFFAGGLLREGWYGISFPSGHAAESVLIYGMVVYLLVHWTRRGARAARWLTLAVAAIACHASVVSFWLGWHWVTDLVAGAVAGTLLLRLVIEADRRGWLPGRAPRAAEVPEARDVETTPEASP